MEFLTQMNFATPSWDLFIVLFFVVAVFLYGLSLGRDRVLVILVSIYMALAVINTAPYLDSFTAEFSLNNQSIFKVTIFLGIFLIIFFLMSRSALRNTIASADVSGRWFHVLIFSFFHVGLLLSVTLGYLPEDIVQHISENMRELFISEQARFFWLVTPVVAMVMIKPKRKEE